MQQEYNKQKQKHYLPALPAEAAAAPTLSLSTAKKSSTATGVRT